MEDSEVINQVLREIKKFKDKKFMIEIALIIGAVITTIITVYFLYYYQYQISYWFLIPLSLYTLLSGLALYVNNIYKPNWRNFSLNLINEMKIINVLEVSDFIRDSQGFIGTNYIHSSK
ncbi:MAG: hypothetical protein EU549_00935, partial [Promethearchaeota archaeon]